MAAVAAAPTLPRLRSDVNVLNTLPNPRSPSPSSSISRSNSNASTRHPDLTDEVANLSSKLVNAINHQTQLDDSLQATKHELEQARQQIERLEAAAKEHAELLKSGLLIRKEDADKERNSLLKDVEDERTKRVKAENEKKKGEQELQELTAALFTEANTMVETARRDTANSLDALRKEHEVRIDGIRKEKEASDRKNEQLRHQLNDAETLLQSHQAQLQDLKAVVEKISSEKDEEESTAQISTAPSTPGIGIHDKFRFNETTAMTPMTPSTEEIQADHPLKFSHLLQPILRTDGVAYRDFQELMKLARSSIQSTPASRVSSGSFGSINVLGLVGAGASQSPNGPASPKFSPALGSSSPREAASTVPSLKDTKVYKRALVEDIEPTLRLDIAPGLSWMARRTVLSSMTAGSMNIEPLPTPTFRWRGPVFACALCGESRVGEQYTRKLCFRTSEADDSSRYPLCEQCLIRVRTTCDYISFLRMIRDGHWRSETDEDVKSAWEESVRLRERMFWQRIQGGVVPAFLQRESPVIAQGSEKRISSDNSRQDQNLAQNDPFVAKDDVKGPPPPLPPRRDSGTTEHAEQDEKDAAAASEQLRNEQRDSLASKSSDAETVLATEETVTTPSPEKNDKRLSVTIPGSFE